VTRLVKTHLILNILKYSFQVLGKKKSLSIFGEIQINIFKRKDICKKDGILQFVLLIWKSSFNIQIPYTLITINIYIYIY